MNANANVAPAATITSTFVGQAPPPFMESPDSAKTDWNTWFLAWDNYLTVLTSLSPGQFTDGIKNAMLLNALGSEGFRLSTADPVLSAPATTTPHQLQDSCHPTLLHQGLRGACNPRPPLPPAALRRKTVGNYLAELRSLAKRTSLAQFTHEQRDAESYILAAMLALGVQSRAIQQRLLREEQVTLQAFYNIAASAETAESDQRTLSDGQNKQINKVTRRGRSPSSQRGYPRDKPSRPHRSKSTRRGHHPSDVCMRCDRSGCHNDKDQCPALSSICDKCGKLGHYARICQSSSSKPAKVSTVRFANPLTTAAQFHQPPSIHCLGKTKPIRTAHNASNFQHNDWHYDLHFMLPSGRTTNVPSKIDTGADVTLVSSSTYDAQLSAFPLSTPQTALTNFDGTPIRGIRGTFTAPVQHGEHTAKLLVYVVPDHMPTTTGADAIHQLQLILDGSSKTARAVTTRQSQNILAEFPTLGTFPDFKHEITLRDGTRPTPQKVRPIPIAIRDAVR